LPIAYNIAISQIAWAYIFILPFQLYTPLGWIAIPGTLGGPIFEIGLTVAAAYIILGIVAIPVKQYIHRPIGNDNVNITTDIVEDFEWEIAVIGRSFSQGFARI
jgi:putative membrane protein